jgi:glycosyltransferase involved in cell wall biosynthesis
MSVTIFKDIAIENIKPLVSIDIITYNHEKFISQAIEGVLMQNVSFLYDLVICDDFSTDDTRNILLNYQKKYPDKIILRFQDKNLGLRFNYFENKKACRGKYIAICEGDDYWTDPNKLQKQVDFLEKNDDYSMLFTNSLEVFEYESWKKNSKPFCKLEDKDYTGADLLKNWLVPTATVVYRNNISYEFRNINSFLFYDIPLFLKLSQYGKVRGLNEITAIYRRHDKSITNQEIPYKKYFSHLKALNIEFEYRYTNVLPYLYANLYFSLAKSTYKKRSIRLIYYTLLSLYYDSSILLPHFKRKIRTLLGFHLK